MDDSYYILEDGEQTGPFTLDELISKEPDIHTRVLSPNEDTWQDACDLPELYEYFIAQGLNFPTEDNLASFWIRLLAFVIDLAIVYVVLGIVIGYLIANKLIVDIRTYTTLDAYNKMPYKDFLVLQVIFISALVIYNSVCEASSMKGSVGKRICRLVVVDADGVGISYLNALGRSLARIVSLSFYGIGFISIFWSEHRQALHDYIARTYVVRRY